MRAVIQRVSSASVTVGDEIAGAIGRGLVVLLGVAQGDKDEDARYLADKIVGLRIFADDNDKMNRSLLEVGGQLLVVSQFTLLGDCRKGRRPSFVEAAPPELAEALYETFVGAARTLGATVATGRFRQNMQVTLVNDGPVTLMVESRSSSPNWT
jgi:D-aminoacyl-tRNA deacylase